MNALAHRLDTYEVTQALTGALRRHVANDRHGLKIIAGCAGANVEAAKNWLDGRCAPSAVHILRLMATVPEFQAEVRRLTAMESDLDPMLAREMNNLFQTWLRTRGGQ